MKRLMRKLEALFAAVAFAEEGEAETARRIMAEAGMDGPAQPRARRADPPSPSSPRAALASSSER